MYLVSNQQRRKGSVVPLCMLLLIVVIAVLAFSVDISWIVLTKHQLQSAADASALAGADPLMDGSVKYSIAKAADKQSVLTASLQAARDKAKLYCQHNKAGGVAGLVLRDADIEFGFLDAAGKYTPSGTFDNLVTQGNASSVTVFPNTIKVVVRRDTVANGSLKLFFAPVIGTGTSDLSAIAAATSYGDEVDGQLQAPIYARMLPITYDVNDWHHFLKTGESPDGSTVIGPDGLPQLRVYPSVKDKGNFGELALDDAHAGTAEINNWINNGLTKTDIATLYGNNLLPLSQHDPNAWDWRGNPGFRSSTVKEMNNYTGELFLLALYKPYSDGGGSQDGSTGNNGKGKGKGKGSGKSTGSGGNGKSKGGGNNTSDYQAGVEQGSWYEYNVVELVGVRITTGVGEHREVTVQPGPYIDPFVAFKNLRPVGTSGKIVTTFTTPKLTR